MKANERQGRRLDVKSCMKALTSTQVDAVHGPHPIFETRSERREVLGRDAVLTGACNDGHVAVSDPVITTCFEQSDEHRHVLSRESDLRPDLHARA